MIRTFIALELDEETRRALGGEIAYLKSQAPKVRWVRPENLHVTLKFIGDVPDSDIREIFDIVDDVAALHDPFSLRVAGLGCFPDFRRMRVVWAGCDAGGDNVSRIAADLQAECARYGYKPERKPFSPHVTIGRLKLPREGEMLEDALEDGRRQEYGVVDVSSITVFMSELKRGGAEYTAMHHAPLGE